MPAQLEDELPIAEKCASSLSNTGYNTNGGTMVWASSAGNADNDDVRWTPSARNAGGGDKLKRSDASGGGEIKWPDARGGGE